ncbi:hypothetical protein N9J04_00010 [Candidatus Pelagibacter sp.]|nr:hypothetical protein [Candidatus Pelagibacter sp.]
MNKIILLFLLTFCLLSCVKVKTTKISNDIKIVKYAYSKNKEVFTIKKFNKEFNQWFEAECPNIHKPRLEIINFSDNCIKDLKYTKLAKVKMASIIQNLQNDSNSTETTQSTETTETTQSTESTETAQSAENIQPQQPQQPQTPSELE